VNIVLTGETKGYAPHAITYAIDLPGDKLKDADFLWLDNGVWLGDKPTGTKVLESPGLHRISVLVVTKQAEEFRGYTFVNVLSSSQGRSSNGSPPVAVTERGE